MSPLNINDRELLRERFEPRARRAAENDDVEGLRKILEAVAAHQHETEIVEAFRDVPRYDYQRLLRLSLLRSAEFGKFRTSELVLQLGAKTEALPSRQGPLLRAVHGGHSNVVQLLVKHGANVDERDRNGMTALMHSALRNEYHILDLLLRHGANVNAQDHEGKTVLHHLAADNDPHWGKDILKKILATQIQIDAKDKIGRTALHWACAMGNLLLAQQLLAPAPAKTADIGMPESLLRTPLHLAVAHGRSDIVSLLLTEGADVNLRSAGGWTPLHIACQRAKFSHQDAGIAQRLLENGALVNVQTSTGETPLHLAAECGVQSILESLLRCPDIRLDIRDEYGNTPFSKAVRAKSKHGIHLLAPFHMDRLSETALEASKCSQATIVDFGNFPNGKRRTNMTMYDLLYAKNTLNGKFSPLVPGSTVSPRNDKGTAFRWIHIPANNVAWAEALLKKAFVEDGNYDVEKFMAAERSLESLHRGQRFESHYMRPFCEATSGGVIGRKSAAPILRRGTGIGTEDDLMDHKSARMADPIKFLRMPYVHFQRAKSLPAMELTIRRALLDDPKSTMMMLNTSHIYEEVSGRQHLQSSNNDFDIRALSFYRKVESSGGNFLQKSDSKPQPDEPGRHTDLFLYMVGQLWVWIFNKDLIITSLPQQWNLPKDDHLNLLEGIIKDIKNRSKETVQVRNVIDLASIIIARCIGTLDSRVMKEKDYPFLDKFESAVSGTDQQVDGLFSQFNSDSRQASEWLKRQRGSNRFLKRSEENGDRANDDNSVEPECVDRLLDINPETNLLDQIQSLRDEFQLLTSILANQTNFMTDFVDNVRLEGLELYSTKQLGVIRTHLKDIDRMEHHVNAIYASITNLLDLKHRYANVFEARFARYQATDTVHQGQTIMVFTIVTIIFLPLSFIGTMFTINISDFPQGNGGEPSMSLAYVSKWVFGIGFAISIPLVVVALSYESMMRFGRERRNFLREKWKRKQRKPKKDIEEADWKNMIDGTLNVIRDFDTLAHMRDDERTVPVKTK